LFGNSKGHYFLGAIVFFPSLYWYCYSEIQKDYISKWIESSKQIFDISKMNEDKAKAESIAALAILNKDLWAKRLFSSFFAAVVFRARNTCDKCELVKQYPKDQDLMNGFLRRAITEKQVFDLLSEYMQKVWS
jgi:hypothetical protein